VPAQVDAQHRRVASEPASDPQHVDALGMTGEAGRDHNPDPAITPVEEHRAELDAVGCPQCFCHFEVTSVTLRRGRFGGVRVKW
jgi:hypothetical protein